MGGRMMVGRGVSVGKVVRPKMRVLEVWSAFYLGSGMRHRLARMADEINRPVVRVKDVVRRRALVSRDISSQDRRLVDTSPILT